MRKYCLAAGVSGVLLLIISIFIKLPTLINYSISQVGGITPVYPFLYYLCFIILIGLFFLCFFRLDKIRFTTLRRVISAIIIILSLFIYFALICDVVLITANLVTMEPLQKEEIYSDSNKELEKNYYEYEKVVNQFNNKINQIADTIPNINDILDTYDYKNKDAEQLLKATKTERAELLNILCTKVISIPNPDLSDSKNYQEKIEVILTKNTFNSTQLKNFYKCELLDINRNLYNENKQAAIGRYTDLWESIDNLYQAKNTNLISYMIRSAYTGILKKFYIDNQKMMVGYNLNDLSKVLLNIEKNTDSSFQSSLTGEYFGAKEILNASKDQVKWPFFDYNKTVNTFYKEFKTGIDNCSKPYYMLDKNTDLEEKKSIFANIINPIGNTYVNVLAPKTNVLIEHKERFKSDLRAMNYSINRNSDKEVPIDNLTGKKYVIKEYTEYYEISSEYNENGRPLFTYKIYKK